MAEFILDPKQAEAVSLGCDIAKRIVGITGAAGSGKTTIMRLVHAHLVEKGYRVALCAPTGKAAKRIKEATGIDALTIHRLLEYSHPGERHPKTGKVMGISAPKCDRSNPLEVDVVLADEYAMVNQEVHANLIDALPRGGCVRCFGDVNQLTPIEEGGVKQDYVSPFQQILTKFPSVYLDVNHRQSEGSGIIKNGWAILRGRMPTRMPDFSISITDEPVKVLQKYVALQDRKFAELGNQIITCTRVRWTGTLALNIMLQQMFGDPSAPIVELPRHTWDEEKDVVCRIQVGSKVIVCQNIHDLQVWNGETGIVTELTEYGEVAIDLGDREVVIPPQISYTDARGVERVFDPRKDIELAYAVTTHKMQGSEVDEVVYVLNKSTVFMQNRANTYTAVTRARKSVHMIVDQRSLSSCVQPERRK